MRRSVLFVPTMLLIAAAGCGGATHYTLDATSACLQKVDGASVGSPPPSDVIAQTALGGAVNVKFADNQVTLTFGQDDAQASVLARAYRRFRGKNIGIESALEQVKNVVLIWGVTPANAERGAVHDCLK